jgi:hypothetical protein
MVLERHAGTDLSTSGAVESLPLAGNEGEHDVERTGRLPAKVRLFGAMLVLCGALIGAPVGWLVHSHAGIGGASDTNRVSLFLTGPNYDLLPLNGGTFARIKASAPTAPTAGEILVAHSSTYTVAYAVVSVEDKGNYWTAYAKLVP